MTITLGWWAIPTLLTLGGFVWLNCQPPPRGPFDTSGIFLGAGWLIASLVVWLIWAVLT